MKLRVAVIRLFVLLALAVSAASCDDPPTSPGTPLFPPTVTSFEPLSGSADGGDSMTITGTDFTNVQAVTIGDIGVSSFTVESSTKIIASVPAGPPSEVDVIVTTAGGSGSSAAVPLKFTWIANALTAFTLSSNAISPGQSMRGTVTLTFAAPFPGLRLPLTWTSNPASSTAVLIPTSIPVPAGSTTGSFEITTFFVSRPQTFQLTTEHGGQTLGASFTLSP